MSKNINTTDITIKDFIPTIIWVVIVSSMVLGSVHIGFIYAIANVIILVPIHLFWYWKGSLRKKRIIVVSIYCSLAVMTYGYQLYVDYFSAQIRNEMLSYVGDFYSKNQYYPSKEEFRAHFPRGYGSAYQMTMISYGINEKDNFYMIFYVQGMFQNWDYFSTNGEWQSEWR